MMFPFKNLNIPFNMRDLHRMPLNRPMPMKNIWTNPIKVGRCRGDQLIWIKVKIMEDPIMNTCQRKARIKEKIILISQNKN